MNGGLLTMLILGGLTQPCLPAGRPSKGEGQNKIKKVNPCLPRQNLFNIPQLNNIHKIPKKIG